MEVHRPPAEQIEDDPLAEVDAGERAAIQLAVFLRADLLLMDDRRGTAAARRYGLIVTGTLGIFDLAAATGRINFVEAVYRLRLTNFRIPTGLLDALLEKHNETRRSS